MFSIKTTVKIDPKEIAARYAANLQGASGVQAIFANRVARDTDPFVPYDTGMLASSVLRASDFENGLLVYNEVYARRLYYGVTFNFSRDKHPQATHHWFEAAKARLLDAWGRYISHLMGGKWRRG